MTVENQSAYWAHADSSSGHWEVLEDHLRAVAEGGQDGHLGAAEFAEAFGCGEWGKLLGLWHDLGKYAPQFQQYLKQTAELSEDDPRRRSLRGSVNHSFAGALHAVRHCQSAGRLLAYCIAGHHAGLPNTEPADGESEASGLEHRLCHPFPEAEDALSRAPLSLLDLDCPPAPPLQMDGGDPRRMAFQVAFLTRMLFSCLVDADFLATERFLQPDRAELRPSAPPSMAELSERVDSYIERLAADSHHSHVNDKRAFVVRACQAASQGQPGFFSLAVPTGGGKTLSSLSFALRHAKAHGLRRVIVAIPFTSIIEQNADAYRNALGDHSGGIVVEHHSNLDPLTEGEQGDRNRLAAENWDRPVVVTTNVQLLESLFAHRTSRCRKLHRIAASVIVLDEAQALPPNLLAPTLQALRELVNHYGCSVVTCTATQPALESRREFPIGIDSPKPIVPPDDRDEIFTDMKRVELERASNVTDAALTDRLAEETQVLCIVNTRRHAAELFISLAERLGEREGDGVDVGRHQSGACFHLSANMCPRHRAAVLRLIRRRLKAGLPCRVVSTQLVEAGVDVDFPVVYRAMAGLDSIAQAAGRCNREGCLERLGRVVVFDSPMDERSLPHFMRQPVQTAREVLEDHSDPLSPEAQYAYFALHYWKRGGDEGAGWDQPPGSKPGQPGVLKCFDQWGQHLQFRKAAERYQLIADNQRPVVVPYGRRGAALADQLRKMPEPPGRGFDRLLQRVIVTVHDHSADELLRNRVLWPPEHTHGRLTLSNESAYDPLLGLRTDVMGVDPEQLMI